MTETDNTTGVRWFFRPVAVIVAILVAGPFAIPLIWLSPAFNKWQKVVLTIAITLLTIWMIKASMGIYQQVVKELQDLQNVMK